MSWQRILEQLPADFQIQRAPSGSVLAVADDAAAGLATSGFGPDSDGDLQCSDLSGRKALGELTIDGQRVVVRHAARGGAMRFLARGFGNPARVFRELIHSARLAAAGVDTPPVVLARARPLGGSGLRSRFGWLQRWSLDLGTRRVEDSEDLALVVERRGANGHSNVQVSRALDSAGRAVARMHAAGFKHADLNPRNILIQFPANDAPRAWIIDLDRGSFEGTPLSDASAQENLRRLARWLQRRERRERMKVSRADMLRFLRAATDAGDWKPRWRAIERESKRNAWWHSLGWRLERGLGRTPNERDGIAAS